MDKDNEAYFYLGAIVVEQSNWFKTKVLHKETKTTGELLAEATTHYVESYRALMTLNMWYRQNRGTLLGSGDKLLEELTEKERLTYASGVCMLIEDFVKVLEEKIRQ